jgi:hypothetical protein
MDGVHWVGSKGEGGLYGGKGWGCAAEGGGKSRVGFQLRRERRS